MLEANGCQQIDQSRHLEDSRQIRTINHKINHVSLDEIYTKILPLEI